MIYHQPPKISPPISPPKLSSPISPPKISSPISPPRLDGRWKRDLVSPPRADNLPESQPKVNTLHKSPPRINNLAKSQSKINTVPKSPPKISPPENDQSKIEKNKVINIKEKESEREKGKSSRVDNLTETKSKINTIPKSPPKISPQIDQPKLDKNKVIDVKGKEHEREKGKSSKVDNLIETKPKINTVPKSPPKISPPIDQPKPEKNKVDVKENEHVGEKEKTNDIKISNTQPLKDRQKKSEVPQWETQNNTNQSSKSQTVKETNSKYIVTPLVALGLADVRDTNNKTLIKDNNNEITIEDNEEKNTDNVDTNKFSLWRGGIRLSGNLTLLKNMINSITFEYNTDFAKFFLKIDHPNIDYISLSTQLGYVLGFENPQLIKNKEVAKYGSDLRGGFSSFGVYVKGLTEKMIIGDSLSSLLRVVSISGATPGEYNEKIYDTPIYARVLPKEINDIEVELRTLDDGRLVPFSYGTVLIVLIFKKVINF
uniref:Uncharacterized protein n=1 Tax=Meloidogyne enterolobii TaxID=390850 RepID=A0A6V7X8U1_MELEN|nr:unnamed protein product [Meloidogyne enterolobii]